MRDFECFIWRAKIFPQSSGLMLSVCDVFNRGPSDLKVFAFGARMGYSREH